MLQFQEETRSNFNNTLLPRFRNYFCFCLKKKKRKVEKRNFSRRLNERNCFLFLRSSLLGGFEGSLNGSACTWTASFLETVYFIFHGSQLFCDIQFLNKNSARKIETWLVCMSGTPESDTYILSEIFPCFRRTVFFHFDINYYIISRWIFHSKYRK